MTYLGPTFRLVDTIDRDEFVAIGRWESRATPLLVKNLVTDWPAWEGWSLEHLAALAGDDVVATFQNGLIEQGATKEPLVLPIGPYLQRLAKEAERARRADARRALCPDAILSTLGPTASFRLDWSFLQTFVPDRLYLGQWDILRAFPQLKSAVRLETLWRGRSNWPSVWIGPAHTVTGLHTDYPDNWFCQIRGEKEFLLFAPEDRPFLSPSTKYDTGSELSRIDVMRLHQGGAEAALLSRAQGVYARVRPGDALFVPRETWHSVVALEPSVSVSVFGLTVFERLTGGVREVALELLHRLGWYRRGDCTCHGAQASRY